MASFIDVRMSTRVGVGFSAVPMRLTRVKTLENGHEKRDGKWASAKRRYTSEYAEWTREMRAGLLDHIEAMEGQLYSFRFKDFNDWKATGQELGLAPAGTTPIQLIKTYSHGPRTTTRIITKPVRNKVTIYEGGVEKSGTMDYLTGLFTPSGAWSEGAPVTADFQFDVPVRFATDEVEFVLPHLDSCTVRCNLIEVFGE